MKKHATVYHGLPIDAAGGGRQVLRNGATLSPGPSQAIWNHSPNGFQWSYHGSGPAQLALALLLDATGDKDLAVALHQEFKRDIVANWDQNGWDISKEQIQEWVKERQTHGQTEVG